MSTDFDDFVVVPADTNVGGDGSKTPSRPRGSGQMWLPAPAVNSMELYIRAQIVTEAALQTGISFVDDEGVVETKHHREFADDVLPQTPELAALRSRIFNHLQRHASLCRSLGPDADLAMYRKACAENGMEPLPFPLNEYK